MNVVNQLGYVGLSSQDIQRWNDFSALIGATAHTSPEGVLNIRIDNDRDSRLQIVPGETDGLLFAGWETDGPESFRTIRERLMEVNALAPTPEGLAQERGVEEILRFNDPDGSVGELYWGAGTALRTKFISPLGTQFSTGDCGMGHVTFAVADFRATFDFYTQILGMKLSEIADVGGARVAFLRCNPRHHSLAFVELPSKEHSLMHISIEVEDFDDLGLIRDRLLDSHLEVERDLGRHPTDGVISLYVSVAPGIEIELGWGSAMINDETWATDQYHRRMWAWGHRVPTKYSTEALGEGATALSSHS